MLNLFQLICLIAALLSSLICTAWIGHYAIKRKIMDIPNHRSSHLEPTLRGGGMSIIIVFLAFTLFAGEGLPGAVMSAILVGSLIVALTGWFDDYKHLSPFIRLLFHFSATLFSLSLLGIPAVPLGGWSVELGWLGYLLMALVLVWCLNFFNFMDGTDGLAAIQAATMALSAAVILALSGNFSPFLFYLLLLCAATVGFLVWNWSPAKIFMGDAASGFLGFVLGLFAISTSVEGQMNLWCWLILFGVFGADATVTLLIRAFRKQTLSEAHRQHAYQRLAMNLQAAERTLLAPEVARVAAHRIIALGVAGINLFWLLPLALAAALMPAWGAVLAAVALLPLAIIVFNVQYLGGRQGMEWL